MKPDPYSDIWDTDAEEEMIAFCSMFGYWAPLELPSLAETHPLGPEDEKQV